MPKCSGWSQKTVLLAVLNFLENKLMRLYSNTASPYAPIFQHAPIFEQPLPPVTFPSLKKSPKLYGPQKWFTYQNVGNYRPRSGKIIDLVASVRPFVCLCVSPCSPGWTVWPLTMIFSVGVDLDLGYFWIVGQGRRSRSNAQNGVFASLLPCFKGKVKGRGQGQRSGSRSQVKVNFSARSGRY